MLNFFKSRTVPETVKLAAAFQIILALISLALISLNVVNPPDLLLTKRWTMVISAVITIAFYGVFIWGTINAKNWVRIWLTVLEVLGIVAIIIVKQMNIPGADTPWTLANYVQTALQLATIVLLWLPASNSFFAKPAKNVEPESTSPPPTHAG